MERNLGTVAITIVPLKKRRITVVGRELDGRPLRIVIEENEAGEFPLPRALILDNIDVSNTF